ncbi:hypothetical protein AAFF_G00249150 [Aldrovandia affinis]|uniref:Uncharacterized protein n=1 Tax=Aldrovandia affinis TaxID=143900 RepID=A0AAD7RFX5_9TELE|nr:hypothetical protein AAFF_G00249150 [Aldrovandia affinis]
MFNCWGQLLLFLIFITPTFSASADCGTPSYYPNTKLRYPNRTAYSPGDRVFYSCVLGYAHVYGASYVRCEAGGWTRLKMECERKSCGSAGELLNGHFDYMGLEAEFGDEVAAVCNEGYRLKGDRYRRCLDSGWSGEIPSCEEGTEITCQSPSVANGVKIKGEAPVYSRGNRVTFNCTRDFSLIGSREITCGPDGQWHPNIPKCLLAKGNFVTLAAVPSTKPNNVDLLKRGNCSEPTTYPDMHVTDQHLLQKEFPAGSEVRYACFPGYRRIAGRIVVSRCVRGQWTSINLKCERKTCGSAGEILNGRYEYKGASFGDTVFAVCNEGFEMIGRNYRQCQDQGWDGNAPVCEAVKCDDLPEVVNGERIGQQEGPFAYGTVMRYRCRQGQLIGDKEIYCTKDGTWSASTPECRSSRRLAEVTCQSPSVANGVKIKGEAPVYSRGNNVTFTCTRGFSLIGSREITCGPDGQWHPKIPECLSSNDNNDFHSVRGSCGAPTTYPDMYVTDQHLLQKEYPAGSEVRYTCSTGYQSIRGMIVISRCDRGRWTSINLKCERKSCGSAGEILNGRYEYKGASFGDTVSAVCNEGYEMIGRSYRQCQDRGWDGNAPVCEAVKCDDLPEVVNAERIGQQEGPFAYGTVMHYRCRQGQLFGDKEIHCTKDGTWSASPPECKDITCPNPSVKFGRKTGGYGPYYKYGSYVSFKCNTGYRLSGPRQVTCGLNGQWTPSLPQCKPKAFTWHPYNIFPR